MEGRLLIYGANGYTGELIARLAVERGLRPTLSARRAEAIAPLAAELGLDFEVVSLDDTAALDSLLSRHDVVLHCAGPFMHTARPMAEACLRTKSHYLDITGEIEVFELLHAMGAAAAAAGVMLLPGVGFDVVPSDCLAAHLKKRMPQATSLSLAFLSLGGLSRGTATTMAEGMGRGGAVRRDGRIVPVPPAWKMRHIDFGTGVIAAVSIPWGDVSTAYYSTGIPNVTVYMATPTKLRWSMRATRYLGPLLRWAPVKQWLVERAQARRPGPSEAQRKRGFSLLWGEASDDSGRTVTVRMRTPNGYTLTAQTAVAIAERVLAGQLMPGFQTPSLLLGADFILSIREVARAEVA
ncbi:MAG: Saccharopine dehydrogenase [Gemmatimonadetes bacterium]|nr:Saccharopine dehydrogenase [Gemmatimonadota bacterium]